MQFLTKNYDNNNKKVKTTTATASPIFSKASKINSYGRHLAILILFSFIRDVRLPFLSGSHLGRHSRHRKSQADRRRRKSLERAARRVELTHLTRVGNLRRHLRRYGVVRRRAAHVMRVRRRRRRQHRRRHRLPMEITGAAVAVIAVVVDGVVGRVRRG